ncbi:MAG: FAD-dependent oxidoreductase [Candidatus Omnitrophica bacterium]|nr:FAD-dependent oxidoreductase [Candidatus Omnitrophota bacterium]
MKEFDLLILGAGPAGITAAVYAARKKIDFALISQDIGGQAAWSGDIENYTGYQFITGPELTLKFQEHIEAFGIDVHMPEKIAVVSRTGKIFTVTTDQSEYAGRSVIVATGKRSRTLNVPGEEQFRNRGVTYCATCDGPLFKGKPVAVVGGGNSGLDAALQLMRLCPNVYVLEAGPALRGDAVMQEKLKAAAHVEIITAARVQRIFGEKFVQGIEIEQAGRQRTLAVQGVFVEIGLIPNAEFATILERNTQGEIVVDCHNRTNVEGVFAAGDVTSVPEKQIIIACGEGSKACLAAFHYLSTHRFP